MEVTAWIAHHLSEYAYLAVAVGTFFEGEIALLLAGIAAWHGHLSLSSAILAAIVATAIADFLHYYAGRRYGTALLRRYPSLARRSDRLNRVLCRHDLSVIFVMRFLWGLRSAGLVAFGMSDIPMLRFVILNTASVVFWGIGIGLIGYFFGGAVQRILAETNNFQLGFAAVLLAAATGAWLLYRRVRTE